ncbi:hypothetical protein DKX38_023997 [Salix brachista]|uniref:Uncharacterized protein n=1 Tax=Salix brachista TaxID=2182728 RepID=A0A5N5JK98_9ROSI|nr:hypothetical protein DKX38_023997 [Salix brachista]
MKGSSDNATTPESKEILIEEAQPVEGGDEMEKNQTLQKDKNDCLMVSDTFHKKLDPEAPDKISTGRSTSIFAEELSMVLKHYGLDCQDENEKHLPAETLVLLANGYHLLQEVEEELYLY